MTKDAVLSILRKEKTHVSGEAISAQLGISRAAVNTAVKALRNEGFSIQSTTNRGYLLCAEPDAIDARALSAFLSEERMKTVLCVESVDSTNNRLKDLAFSGAPDGQVMIANEQTAGRGRMGRSFLSLKDQGIYLSMLLRPESLPSDIAEITAWTAVAISGAVEEVYGVAPGIKWVNDLVMNGKKICGILTEMSVETESGRVQYVIVGIGVNVNQPQDFFPEELRHIATSLAVETGKCNPRAQLAAAMIRHLDQLRADWPKNKQPYLDTYRANNITAGKDILVVRAGEERPAKALSVNDDFSLQVQYPDGTEQTIFSGEVSIRGIYGTK